MGVKNVIITLGSKGCLIREEGVSYRIDAFKVEPVDTTAAGDTFTGFFVAGLVKGLPMKEVLDLCAKAAAIAVSRKGAVASIPTMDEVLHTEL